MSRPTRAGSAGKPVTIRATDAERERWDAAAICSDMKLSDWARPALDAAASKAHLAMPPERWGAAIRLSRRRRRAGKLQENFPDSALVPRRRK